VSLSTESYIQSPTAEIRRGKRRRRTTTTTYDRM